MIKKIKDYSLKKQLIIIIAINVLFFALYITSYISETQTVFTKSNDDYTNTIIQQLEDNINENYRFLENIIHYISFQPELQEFLMTEDATIKYDLYQTLFDDLMNIMNLDSNIVDFIIEDSSGNSYTLLGSTLPLPPQTSLNDKTELNSIKSSQDELYFILQTPVTSTDLVDSTNRKIGKIYMVLDSSTFTANTTALYLNSQTQLYLLDEDSNSLWQNNNTDITEIDERTLSNSYSYELKNLGFRILVLTQQEQTFSKLYATHEKYVFLLLFLLSFLLSTWYIFVANTVQSLNKLTEFISMLKNGVLNDLSKRIDLTGFQEMKIISEQFNGMLGTINTLTRQVFSTTTKLYEAEIAKEQAELQYLRSQINPHFLYNTLESLKGMAAESGNRSIVQFTKALSTIFKYSVKGEALVPFHEELKIIKSYIYIQLMRFEDRFYVQYDISDEVLDRKIPKMILQPIVENAIVHGIENTQTSAKLEIRSYISANKLYITVYNEGIPIPANLLANIKEKLNKSSDFLQNTAPTNIGIYNVNNRIHLIYGDEYYLDINSDDTGTTVRLCLPAE